MHTDVATQLGAMSESGLTAALQATSWRASVHGSQTGTIEVGGAKVFVKQIALTDLELSRRNAMSTANLFELPLFYQYGIGSAGFGARRELQASLRAGAWALSGECAHFPLVYHWRVLPRTPPALNERQIAWLERAPARWGNSDAIRARLEALSAASSSITLFLEHAPQTLHDWLHDRPGVERPAAALEAAILRFHEQWHAVAAFMNERGMLHFDLNPDNVLTDGEQLYVADFGLAICSDFDLSPAERGFFETHRLYDRCYADWAFVQWLTPERTEPPYLTPALKAQVDRCTPVFTVFENFLERLKRNKSAAFPAEELQAALAVPPAVG